MGTLGVSVSLCVKGKHGCRITMGGMCKMGNWVTICLVWMTWDVRYYVLFMKGKWARVYRGFIWNLGCGVHISILCVSRGVTLPRVSCVGPGCYVTMRML